MKKLYQKYKEKINYLFFGGCTTLVNILTYYICTRLLFLDVNVSIVISWITSVIFAYITNKLFVFNAKNTNIIKEFLSFIIVRLISLGVDYLIMYLLYDLLSWNDLVVKIIANIVVIVLNYIFSKLLVFKKEGK